MATCRACCILLVLVAQIVCGQAAGDSASSTPASVTQPADSSSVTDRARVAGDTTDKAPSAAPVPARTAQAPAPSTVRFNTEIPGGILYGEFTKNDGPYLITGSIIVPSGQKLQFGPGCEIYMGGTYSTITVFGQIIARGTAQEPVTFRSARAQPNPWDWDRIYCRSRSRSQFAYCVIEHSNYGIYVENGAAAIEHCTFRNNSLRGLVIRNSEVSIAASTFSRGHVLALMLQPGAVVTADSLSITRNITALACDDSSSLSMTGGNITGNTNAICLLPSAAVSIVATDISHNRTGVISLAEIPRRMREMVYGNDVDARIVSAADMDKLLKPPEEVTSVVLPKSKMTIDVQKGFKPGFVAMKAPQEQTASFMGNVTVGARYFVPRSLVDSLPQQRYPGEQSDHALAGLQPEMQIFGSGRMKSADVSLLMDLYGNEWIDQPLHMRRNSVNLSMNYAGQHLVVGDFFESGSETSLSGRKFAGLRYSGEFLPMGKGAKRMEFKLAAGETEVPKDIGRHELDIYNDTVDTGMSMRQQITYVASIGVKPNFNSSINVKGLISRDQGSNPLFRDQLIDPQAPRPIKSETGCIDGSVTLLDGKLTLRGEVDLGTHDTLDSTETREIDDIAWYNPQVEEAVPSVLGFSSSGTVGDFWSSHLALTLGADGSVQGFDLKGKYTELRPTYFSAGNPYLEADRRIADVSAQRQVLPNLSAMAAYQWERRAVSNVFDLATGTPSPIDKNTFSLSGEWTPLPSLPTIAGEYSLIYEASDAAGDYDSLVATRSDTAYDTVDASTINLLITLVDSTRSATARYADRQLNNLAGIEVKQTLDNGIDYSLKYRMLRENEMTEYPDAANNDGDDGWQHQITGRFGFKIKRIIKNRTTFRVALKSEVRNDLWGVSYKFGDHLQITAIPRKLSFGVKGDFSNKVDEEETDSLGRVQTQTRVYSFGGEAKLSISSRLSITAVGRYEDSMDQTPGSRENYSVKVGGLLLTYLF